MNEKRTKQKSRKNNNPTIVEKMFVNWLKFRIRSVSSVFSLARLLALTNLAFYLYDII
jgi:hypothetical protein